MRRLVQFIDTSILVELLDVPNKASRHQEIVDELTQREAAGTSLVLPTAAIIETGNHVCQIVDGGTRRDRSSKFDTLLRASAAGETPWVLHKATWDDQLLTGICDGAGTGTPLVEHATNQTIGVGDLSILAERDIYLSSIARSVVQVEIWTTDQRLHSWAELKSSGRRRR